MKHKLLSLLLGFLITAGLSFPAVSFDLSHYNDNSTFYKLYGASFDASDDYHKSYVSGEYYESSSTTRLDIYAGVDWNLKAKIVPFVFTNYFYHNRMNSDYLRTGIGSYYMLDDLFFTHKISLALVSETGKSDIMLSWRYKAWKDFKEFGFKYTATLIERDFTSKSEIYFNINKNIKAQLTAHNVYSNRGQDNTLTFGLSFKF